MNASAQNSTSSNNESNSYSQSQESSSDEQTEGNNDNSTSSESSENDNSSSSEESSSDESSDDNSSSESGQDSSNSSEEEQQPRNGTSTTSTDTSSNSTDTTTNQQQPAQNVTSTEAISNATALVETLMQNVTSLVTISGEPLVPADSKIVRSFSYPLLEFEGETAAELAITLTWNLDGSTEISDNRGYRYTISIPESQGAFSLWSNSTHVDQRVIGSELHYDVYWTAVKGGNGLVDKYKYTIAGSSPNGSTISFEVDGGDYDEIREDRFSVNQPSTIRTFLSPPDPSLDWTAPADGKAFSYETEASAEIQKDGLELDWSDAIASGYTVNVDAVKSLVSIPVAKSFFIDPTLVGTSSNYLSPQIDSGFEGEARMVTTYNDTLTRINALYYDGSNIVYKSSDDGGETWSSAISTGSGTIASDIYRWTFVGTIYNNNTYVSLLYFSPSGNNTNFYTIRGTVNGVNISWSSPILLGYTLANTDACGIGGSCAAVTATTDMNGTIFAAFRYRSGGSSTYSYQIMKSTDGGLNWSISLAQVDGFSTSRISMALTAMNQSKVLFVYAKSSSASLFYRVYDGSVWGSEQTLGSTGLATGVVKQLSATSDSSLSAYVAYTNVTATSGGVLKLAVFSNSGVFQAIETADSTLRHSLPNIIVSGNENIDIISIASGKIYNTRKVEGVIWEAPFNPYGTSFSSPNMLTADAILASENGALWTEGSSSPYNLKFAFLKHGTVELYSTVQNSPGYADYFEGERRVVESSNMTKFAFYYDGSNIVYKVSRDFGNTWSSAATSTGTGQLGSDYFRWTIAFSLYNSTNRIALLYFTTSGGSTAFYAKTFIINDSTLELVNTVSLFSATNDASCTPTGVCAAASGAADSEGIFYAVFSYKTGGTWYKKVMRSIDGGQTWSSSFGAASITTTGSRLPITITRLDAGKMLLVWAKYDSSWMWYKVYNGSAWQATQSLSSIGWSTNTIKQISSDTLDGYATNSSMKAYVAYLANGNHGNLKVAKFFGNGTYEGAETADTTIDHWIPAIVITNDDHVRVYSLYAGKVYQTIWNSTTGWQAPATPYGTEFYSPDQLTAQISGLVSAGALWREGSSSPYTIAYSGTLPSTNQRSCNFYVSKNVVCFRSYSPSPIYKSGFQLQTPGTDIRWKAYKSLIARTVGHSFVDTSIWNKNPVSFSFLGKTWYFIFGTMTLHNTQRGDFNYHQWKEIALSSGKNYPFNRVPTHDYAKKTEPMRVIVTYTYCTNPIDPCSPNAQVLNVKIMLYLKSGYDPKVK